MLLVPQEPDFYPHVLRHASVIAKYSEQVIILCLGPHAASLKATPYKTLKLMDAPIQGAWGFISLMWKNYQVLKKMNPDFVHAIDPPSSIPTFFYSLHKKNHWVYFSMEYFTQTPALKKKPLKRWLWGIFERLCLQEQTPVATVCQSIAVHLQKKFSRPVYVVRSIPPLHTKPLEHVENSQPINLPEITLRKLLGISSKSFLLVYQGALEQGRGLFDLVNWVSRIPNVEMVFFGKGPLLESLHQHTNSDSGIHFVGAYPFEDMMELSKTADAGVVWFEMVSKSYEYSLPGKFFEYIQNGLPVISSPNPEIKNHIDKYQVGVYTDGYSKGHFEDALMLLRNKYQHYRKGVEEAQKILTWENESKILDSLVFPKPK